MHSYWYKIEVSGDLWLRKSLIPTRSHSGGDRNTLMSSFTVNTLTLYSTPGLRFSNVHEFLSCLHKLLYRVSLVALWWECWSPCSPWCLLGTEHVYQGRTKQYICIVNTWAHLRKDRTYFHYTVFLLFILDQMNFPEFSWNLLVVNMQIAGTLGFMRWAF